MPVKPCKLALEDGTIWIGESIGAEGTSVGEVVFNTSMTGYQEIITDPSYRRQIVVMTFPLIGNYGVNGEDVESSQPHLAGFVVKELAHRPSNQRSRQKLQDYLHGHAVIGLAGVDTRALTRRIRTGGACRGAVSTEVTDHVELVRLAASAPSMVGLGLVDEVAACTWPGGRPPTVPDTMAPPPPAASAEPPQPWRAVVIDCGVKFNILRQLVRAGCAVTLVRPNTSVEAILEHEPDGVLVTNGPGDPAAVTAVTDSLRRLVGRVPLGGICLGHQLLGLALGATTFKLKFGHHGGNQPVRNLHTGRVEITAQNHGFAVDTDSLEKCGAVPTHVNLNDGSLEGFVQPDDAVFAVQFHPEAAPGPNDAAHLFDAFAEMARTGRVPFVSP